MNDKLQYKLLALDLDGTLINDELIIADAAKVAVAAAVARGLIVTLATGRMYQSAVQFARVLNLSAPLICYQGAMIRHSVTGQTLLYQTLPLDLAREFIDAAQQRGQQVNAYIDDVLYVEKITPDTEFLGRLGQVTTQPVGPLLNFITTPDRAPTKLEIVTPESQTLPFMQEMAALFSPRLYITRSHPRLTEAVNPACNKGAALKALAAHLSVEQAQVMAIGDNLNDLPMLEYAGMGVAVANASPQLKAVAGYVTSLPLSAGVVEAIQKFVL